MPAMLQIPIEVNERILTMSDPLAVAAMAQSCSFFHNLIHRPIDQHLWRSLFLARFDDPRTTWALYSGDINKYPWAPELQHRIRAETLLTRRPGFETLRPEERLMVLRTLTDAVQSAPPPYAARHSQDIEWIQRIVGGADVFAGLERLQNNGKDRNEELELLAQLHVYHGLTKDEKQLPGAQTMRTTSRCFVYDLRKYGRRTLWGPFCPGGRVNWIHVEHIINVISMNLEDIVDLWEEMRPPTGLEATRPYSATGADNISVDWAGVEGKWYRYVCFMDYRDLFAFNFSTSADSETEPLNTSIFEDDEFQEAIRLIELNLRIISIIPCASHPHRPTLKFEGTSKGAQNNEARIEGSVRMTPDGQVRWRFISVYDGETQWSSEGIQVGGVGSAMGVVGTWTGAFHSDRDPVGPFWLWKVTNSGSD